MTRCTLGGLGPCYQSWFSTCRRGAHDAVTQLVDAEKDHVVLVPRAARNITRHIADRMHRTAGHIDLLQLSSGIESSIPAVRRPERHMPDSASSGLRAGERFGFQGVHGSNP